MSRLALYSLVLPLAALVASAAPSSQRLIAFRVEDQFKVEHTQTEFDGQAVLLLWADRKSHGFVRPWATALTDTLSTQIESGQLNLRGVAHVQGAPFFVKGRIRRRITAAAPSWTLLDWKGIFRKAYEPQEHEINFYLFDRSHALVWRESVTTFQPAVVDSLVARVARMELD